MRLLFVHLLAIYLCSFQVFGQEALRLKVVGDRVTFGLNEEVILQYELEEADFKKLKEKVVTVAYGTEGDLSSNFQRIKVPLKKAVQQFRLTTGDKSRILRIKTTLQMDSKTVVKEIGVAVEPELIASTVDKPQDFDTFWEQQLEALKNVELTPKIQLDTNLSTTIADVYQISYQVDQSGSRFYGVLTIPKGTKNQKYPAIVIYPGAGVRGYLGDTRFAKDSLITLQVGVHGIPTHLQPDTYQALATGALNGYAYFNLQSRENYYFNRIIKGCIRALDFLKTVSQFDGKHIMAHGSSQGGALSLIVTALDKRINGAAVYCPAMCQTNGQLYQKATGWPQPLKRADMQAEYAANWQYVMPYYDVVNFALNIDVPVFMTFGMIDDVTPATTIFAAYNQLKAQKSYYLMSDVAHANHPAQIEIINKYMVKNIR